MDKIVERKELNKRIEEQLKTKGLVYIGAHTGWGKTFAIRQYMDKMGHSYEYIFASEEDFLTTFDAWVNNRKRHIVVDNLEQLWRTEEIESFIRILEKAPKETKIYMLGRCAIPPYLKGFYISDAMAVFGIEDLAFSKEEAEKLFRVRGISCSPTDTRIIVNESKGYCVALVLLGIRTAQAKEYSKAVKAMAMEDYFDYMDTNLWNKWEIGFRKILLNLAHLKSFTEKQAEIICGKQNMRNQLERLLLLGSFLVKNSEESYHFQCFFQQYISCKQEKLCSKEQLKEIYTYTALAYILENDVPNALKYYHMAGDKRKVSELLIDNVEAIPSDGYYYDLEKYYLELEEEEVEQSPEMLCAMSMLHSLSMRIEESEVYFEKLKGLEKNLSSEDERKKIAREKLGFLMLSLPHRQTDSYVERLKGVVKSRAKIQKVSITSNMPSLISGGLDFCNMAKREKFYLPLLRPLVEIVLRDYGKGALEIAMGEIRFEKNSDGNFTESLMYLDQGKNAMRDESYVQLDFAANAVLARMYVSQGNMETAKELIRQTKKRVENDASVGMKNNVDAFLVWIALLENDMDTVDIWFESEAPNELEHFYILERYRYLIKCQVYLQRGMHLEGLSLLDQLENYYTLYGRTYNYMQARLLRSIFYYRMKEERWEEVLQEALKQVEEYKFVRIVSDLGVAILEPLKTCLCGTKNKFYKSILNVTQKQAILYPRYLREQQVGDYGLSKAEKTVLKLLVKGLTNAEICELLNIGLPTVKTHAGRIYTKLKVKNRLAAVKMAEEQGIV